MILFALDVLTEMGTVERFVLLVGLASFLGWQCWKVVVPALMNREDLILIATKIQRNHAIPSDLVASLQFTDTQRSQYGSEKLRDLVVETSSLMSEKLDYLAGFSRLVEELCSCSNLVGFNLNSSDCQPDALSNISEPVTFTGCEVPYDDRYSRGSYRRRGGCSWKACDICCQC